MLRLLLLLMLFGDGAIRLYLKEGGFHEVSEYKVLGDRVRYYSTERSEWEEIPVELVDLKKTEGEIKRKADEEKAEDAANKAEDDFEREQRREIAMIPRKAGLYMVKDGQLRIFPPGDVKVSTSKGRNVLKVISPIPIVAGKSVVELDGEASKNTIAEDRPQFYFRLAEEERFGIARVKPRKGIREVEVWNIMPATNEIISERDMVDVFRQQAGDGLYRIWPVKPLPDGEYAMIEYTEGKANTQVWDFRISAQR
ncbi:MAG: hypothetical protein IT161_19750 [Bryobacterales bacterium]|nr:hypothetical protein [Bryobacterales bacterium]